MLFLIEELLFSSNSLLFPWLYDNIEKQLACLSGSNGQQKAQGGYVRHILAGSPKRSHFSSSRRQIINGHVSEISSASGTNGTPKKRVSRTRLTSTRLSRFNFCYLSRNVEREANSNFTGQRFTHHTAAPAYFDASSSSKSSLDSQVVDPMQLGGHLLSFNETQVSFLLVISPCKNFTQFPSLQLCSTLNLPPTRYLTIKTVLLSNPKLTEIEPAEKVILKHLGTSGWVRKTSID